MKRACSIDECEKPAAIRGWCHMHYGRWQRYGDPHMLTRVRAREEDAIYRFLENIAPHESGCWNWTGRTMRKEGYAVLVIKSGSPLELGHRFSYRFFTGPIPDGLVIDHLCRNRRCVNPDHLEAVTLGENVLRGVGTSALNAVKTHCPKGHPYDAENTYVRRDRRGRLCRACGRARYHRLQERVA